MYSMYTLFSQHCKTTRTDNIMACLQMTTIVPEKVTAMAILMSVFFCYSMKTGFGVKLTGACRPVCTGSDCITVNQDRVDFPSAEEACRHSNGELVTYQSQTDKSTLDILSQQLHGSFWIGLHLPGVSCSNLSAPLRGYEWTSGSVHRSFGTHFSPWKESVKVCSPRCVSFSNGHKWTERMCSDRIDGFLCKTKHKDACQAQELSDPSGIRSSEDCSVGPCEHTCTDVKGGYECSCFKGYAPDINHPEQCILHCAQQKCPAVCENDQCFCPEGFIRSGQYCEDIDECLNGCDQDCKNTFGSFVCSCRNGFVLKDQVRCMEAEGSENEVATTPTVIAFVKPATSNHTVKGSSVPPGSVFWMWILVVVAVAVSIFVIRFYVVKRQKRREQNSSQQSTVPVDNSEC